MTGAQSRFAAIGECMIELTDPGTGTLGLGFGGDTLNTSVYVARVGAADGIAVDYVTALGDDPYSDAMLESWRREGIGTGLVARLPGRLPGLYLIRTDPAGERSFYYWRSAAAARELMRAADPERLAVALAACRVVYVSGVTLSILDEAGRAALFRLLDAARAAGARLAFDSNYRPRGWPDADAARAAMTRMLRRADIALPTLDDEQRLFGDADAVACAARIAALGVAEIAVKAGPAPALLRLGEAVREVPAQAVARPLDTTAAGDAFNAAYLARRIAGAAPEAAARAAHVLAATVIGHRGAVIPADAMPALP